MEGEINIHWLVDECSNDAERLRIAHSLSHVDFVIPGDLGRGWFERLDPMPGVLLLRAFHSLKSTKNVLCQLGTAEAHFLELSFSAQTMRGGICHYREHVPEKRLFWGQGKDCFRYGDGYKTVSAIEAGKDTEMTALSVTSSTLRAILGESVVAQLLMELGLKQPPSVNVVPMPPYISALLAGTFSRVYTGRLQVLYAQSKILEYLCALGANVTQGNIHDDISCRQERVLKALHDELLSIEGKLPSLDELAVRYGMSVKSLNNAFKKKYGQTIFAYIGDCRLHDSHIALERTQIPIKVLAARLGFSHPNHFITAFRRKFGYPPGHLRGKS